MANMRSVHIAIYEDHDDVRILAVGSNYLSAYTAAERVCESERGKVIPANMEYVSIEEWVVEGS